MTSGSYCRPPFGEEHHQFREQVRRFIAKEVVPFHREWEQRGQVPREVWRAAGEIGALCCSVAPEWGGSGADALFGAVVLEEMALAQVLGPGFAIHSEMAVPYIVNAGSSQQKGRWLPGLCRGELIAGVAMTEPDAGSDLRGIRTQAVANSEGWTLSGQKTYISNGQLADVFVVAAKVPDDSRGLSLFLVDASLNGVVRGRRLEKLGHHAQDTSELFFDAVQLAPDALLGEEGRGMEYLRRGLAHERLSIAVICQARAEAVLRDTVTYATDRRIAGQRLADYQNTRMVLAGVKTEQWAGRSWVDRLLTQEAAGTLSADETAGAKLWVTEMLGRTTDACLQLHGGLGYMTDSSVARAWADARVERIAGGTSEVMKEIVARTLWSR